jgi:hypothetical protein
MTNPDVAAAAELLFELNEPKLADKLITERAAELNGGFYGSLTSLVEKARNEGCFLAAILILRALLDAILKRAYAKAYGHGARYLRALQELGSRIDDYRGHPTHDVYEQTLRGEPMRRIRRRQCPCSRELFRPVRRNHGRQKCCAKSACRQASKATSQCHCLEKPQSRIHDKWSATSVTKFCNTPQHTLTPQYTLLKSSSKHYNVSI